MRWDAARAASRRELPKPRKMHGPVGERPSDAEHYRNGVLHEGWHRREYHCRGCGYHVCSCKPVELERMFEGNRTIWCFTCHRAYDVTPLGTPRGHCDNCDATGLWWTRVERKKYMFPVTTGVETGQRPGSVDVAGLEMLRAEWFTEYHLRKAAEREF